ncbi:AtzH-like domain-containing protein [Agreia pratensis]|uniref:Asp-tRNAAsn/Glu-tRNAGln amidotransferase A subunit n=1 Tax=Agreia pratensis TaxID=150121 RepID=A0A1X7I5U6_9MICO|nr:AtzH-like domain-containing protein [Agreia pratensis]SMG09395.1 Asp-tRNAAsn/Glu-tRNAGln amidotransferase A subunit [Agreia pratensis]
MAERIPPTSVTGELPDGLIDAFWAYENALLTNDLEALDAAFAPGNATLRGDAGGLLVGHDRISSFRGARGGAPVRTITSIHVRVLSHEYALIVSENEPRSGGRGLVTQLWARHADAAGWVVESAQVAGAPAAMNTAIWRVLGNPLVAPTTSDGGALDGETVAVKDLFDVRGFAVGAGIPEYLSEAMPADANAPALAALLAAGASVRGIAQTDEFAYSIAGKNVHYGTPPNGAVPGAIPGGSSSGPASAVATGHASIALATDTAGSIRVPASYQGLWGLRTTHGAVDSAGLLPLAPSFDTVGWLTRSAPVLRAAAASTLDAESQQPVDAQFVISTELLFAADPAMQGALVDAVGRLEAAGLVGEVGVVDLGDTSGFFDAFRTVQGAEAWRQHGEWITSHPGVLASDVASRFETASTITDDAESSAREVLAAARTQLDEALAGRILLLPSTASTAPSLTADPGEIDAARAATLALTCFAGIGGYPALSVPLLEVEGAPAGLCLVGPRGSDLALIDLASTFIP